jgi:hypothetical protein
MRVYDWLINSGVFELTIAPYEVNMTKKVLPQYCSVNMNSVRPERVEGFWCIHFQSP